ncbi:hypothetical protein FB567DRAFT_606957 [Paraphoma chrysanthemicola]|uniref:F-box domain-containing protein n=1 Tax=Paraphoma chrysanthemicola TaxID=798071 RepID=A0A8K0QZ68_9PLEO|nr:hypothetical protein FB567DRAFT_606957 [Paraphoma chrysanthemicola]
MSFKFLDLPTELRFQVYTIFAIPRDAPFSAYSGLYLSCKRFKAEMDQEVGKITTTYLQDLANRERDVIVSKLNSSPSLERLHLNLSNPPEDSSALFRVLTFIVKLLSLHTASVNISFTSSNVHLDTDQFLNAMSLFNFITPCIGIETQTSKLVLEYPAGYWSEPEVMARGGLPDVPVLGWSSFWQVEAIDEDTSKAIATWARAPESERGRSLVEMTSDTFWT